jgi:hypothetical protein
MALLLCAAHRLDALASHSKVCTAERPHKPLLRQPQPNSAANAGGTAAGAGSLRHASNKSGPGGVQKHAAASANSSSSKPASVKTPNSSSSSGVKSVSSSHATSSSAVSSGHIRGNMCLDASAPNVVHNISSRSSSSAKVKADTASPGGFSSSRGSGFGEAGRMPKALVCYLCGGQFFANR